MYNQRKEDKCHRIAAFGGEAGAGNVEGRGLFAGVTVAGVHAEVSERGGRSLGFQEQLYYKLQDLGKGPDGKKRQYVGLSIPSLGVFSDVVKYDHGNRNDNQIQKEVMGEDGKGISRDAFEKLAKKKGMESGHYSKLGAALHEPHPVSYIWGLIKGLFTGNYPKATVDKMWMQKGDMHWWQVPAVEGLFTIDGKYYPAPSYNYGNNWISHFFFDMVPYWIF